MPWRNRVTPTGDIVAIPLRGAWTGNRGIIHEGEEIIRFHAGNLWITCALEFRGCHREIWIPNRWTPLFFHDEAVAFAAGHRPCGECRHTEYQAYKAAWAEATRGRPALRRGDEPPAARRADLPRHPPAAPPRGRLDRGPRRRLRPRRRDPCLVRAGELVPWSTEGYVGEPRRRPRRGTATVVTPPSSLAVLRAGYELQIDPAARG